VDKRRNQEKENRRISRLDRENMAKIKRKIIRIDEEKCNGCGECIPGCQSIKGEKRQP